MLRFPIIWFVILMNMRCDEVVKDNHPQLAVDSKFVKAMRCSSIAVIIFVSILYNQTSANENDPSKWNWFTGLGINIGAVNFMGSAKNSVRNSYYINNIQTYSINWQIGHLSGSNRIYAFISAGYIGDNPYKSEEPWSGGELVVIATGYSRRLTPWKFLIVNPGLSLMRTYLYYKKDDELLYKRTFLVLPIDLSVSIFPFRRTSTNKICKTLKNFALSTLYSKTVNGKQFTKAGMSIGFILSDARATIGYEYVLLKNSYKSDILKIELCAPLD